MPHPNTPPTLTPPGYQVSFGEFFGIGSNGNLWADGCDVAGLADRFGTPLYIVSENQLRHNYRSFRDAFRAHYPEVEILFANKSNNGLAIRHIMNQEGAGGDCFGAQEMYLALLAGTDPSTLVLNGSNKQDVELEMAIVNGVCINVDAEDELDRIAAIAIRHGRQVDLGIRLKLDLEPLRDRHGVSMHGPGTLKHQSDSTKWGMTREQTAAIVRRALAMPNMRLKETHFHLSRMSNDPADFAVMARAAKKWVNLDISTNHLSWAAVLDWYYHAVPVVNAGAEPSEVVDLVGSLCNSDEIGPHRKMPPLQRGDLVAFLDAGGYTESSAARYNAQLLPATVLVTGDRAAIITEREQLKDVAGRFCVPPHLLAGSFARAEAA
jgi:diaminopimelate decarboxylase